jgi:hypothetical protein
MSLTTIFWVLASVLILTFFAGVGAVLIVMAGKNRREDHVRKTGEVVVGWIVQANNVLFQRGQDDAPAQVLITFDRELADDPDQMQDMAQHLGSLKEAPLRTRREAELAELVRDETARFWRRDKLPRAFTGGQVVYSVAVMVRRRYLPRGRLTEPYIYCVALPGPNGGQVYMTEYPQGHDGTPPRRYRRRDD